MQEGCGSLVVEHSEEGRGCGVGPVRPFSYLLGGWVLNIRCVSGDTRLFVGDCRHFLVACRLPRVQHGSESAFTLSLSLVKGVLRLVRGVAGGFVGYSPSSLLMSAVAIQLGVWGLELGVGLVLGFEVWGWRLSVEGLGSAALGLGCLGGSGAS